MDWALLPLSTNSESKVRFHGDAGHGYPSTCLRRGHYTTQLDPWCGTLLRPDCTRSEELALNFHRRVTCHTYGQVSVVTTCLQRTMREELLGVHWMVPLCNGIMADAVHPQSGKYQTACTTVQGHMECAGVVVFRRYNNGERLSSCLAMVTASTKAKSTNAVVTMGAINAAYLSCSNENSGLPLNWRGGLLRKKAVFTVETLGFPQLGDTQH